MTKTDEWFKNRILNQANSFLLNDDYDYNCFKLEDLDNNVQKCIKNILGKDEIPVLVFFDNCEKWTVLCTQCLCSYYDKKLYYVHKNDLSQRIIPYVNKNGNIDKDGVPISKYLLKENVHWLKMLETGEVIWLPSPKELWSFWGILPMLGKLNPKEI